MDQYVAHKGVYCQVHEVGWRVKLWECPDTGQREVMAWRRKAYVPLGDYDDPLSKVVEIDQSGTELEAERLEAARLRSLARSGARAKRSCRFRIKASGAAHLLTLTYRANMQDYDQVRRDWKAFVRKVVRYWPEFRAVFAFERQARGAWHVHAAISRLPTYFMYQGQQVRSYALLRRFWLSVCGDGNIDVDGHRKNRFGLPSQSFGERRGRTRESLAKLAGYVSKYLTKDYGSGLVGRNRWGSTQNIDVPAPEIFDLPDVPLSDVIPAIFDVRPGEVIATHRIGSFGKFWVLYVETAPPS